MNQYEENASVIWNGKNPLGEFNGTNSISLLMNVSFIGHGDSFALGNLNYTIVDMNAHSAVVNSSFVIFGQNGWIASGFIGNFTGIVSARDAYVYSAADGGWLISQEVWNFENFTPQSSYLL